MVKAILSYPEAAKQKEKDVHRMEVTQIKQQMDSCNRKVTRPRKELDSRNLEIQQLRHGNYIRRVTSAVVPNRAKPYLKAILHLIPQGIKNSVKRLIRW